MAPRKVDDGGLTLVALTSLPFRPGGAHEPSHSVLSEQSRRSPPRSHCRSPSLGSRRVAEPTSWAAPRTADGHPDLMGHWTNDTYTPVRAPRRARRQADLHAPRKPPRFSNRKSTSCTRQADDDIHYDDAIWQAENYAKVAEPEDVVDRRAGQRPITGVERARPGPPAAAARDAARRVGR